MKKINYLNIVITIFIASFLGGCYTQVAMRDRDKDRNYAEQKNNSAYRAEDQYEAVSDTNYYLDNDSTYYDSDEDEGIANNYYFDGFPYHRRYYSYYYPSFSVGIGFGNYYDPFWYPTVWNDPYYYWSWCATPYLYYPYYPYAYSSWYYGDYYGITL